MLPPPIFSTSLVTSILSILLKSPPALSAVPSHSPRAPPFSANLTAFIPFYSLPTSYPLSLLPQDPISENQIRDTLAHYPLAIDGKDFAALNLVFTSDVIANYSEPLGVLTGLSAVESVLEASLAPVRTQHAYGTQLIEILKGGVTARSLTYFTATQFGQGEYYGQVLYSYGQYQDDWTKTCCPEEWRIKARTLAYMGPSIGNLSIFT